MKHTLILLTLLLTGSLIATSCGGNSKKEQVVTDYFVGKWDVEFKEAPGGGAKMKIEIIKEYNKLEGTVFREGEDPGIITEIEETENSVKVYFKHGFFTVNVLLNKIDKINCSAKLMDMFNGTAVRIE